MTLAELKPSDVGRRVIYKPKWEHGVITSWNEHVVFVRYDDAGSTSQATQAGDLEWEDWQKCR